MKKMLLVSLLLLLVLPASAQKIKADQVKANSVTTTDSTTSTLKLSGAAGSKCMVTDAQGYVTEAPCWVAAPATATDTCSAGQQAYDTAYHYICYATNQWIRVALSTWGGGSATTISPSKPTVALTQTQQFTSNNGSVTWKVNGVAGGNSTVGTINGSGLYTAPTNLPYSLGAEVSVTAQSTTDSASTVATLKEGPSVNEYYIVQAGGSDSNICSSGSPCATITGVDAKLVAGTLTLGANGTIIHVGSGTYTGTATVYKSGTASARIRWISDTLYGAHIATSGANFGFKSYANYIDIIGFEITGTGQTANYNGIEQQGAYGLIAFNKVHDLGASSGCKSGGGILSGYYNYNLSMNNPGYNTIAGNWVYNIGDSSVSASCNQMHGIYESAPYGVILNNIVFRAYDGYGIHLWHYATNAVVANNTLWANDEGGILIGCGDITCGAGNDYTYVVNNIAINSTTRYAIEEHGTTGTHNLYLNNLSYNNPGGNWYLQNGLTCQSCVTGQSPAFINYQVDGSGDYHLASNSPAKDTGTSSYAPFWDFDLIARPVNGLWDMGAYEYVP